MRKGSNPKKKNNKSKNNFQLKETVQPKSKKRFWIKAGLASLVFATAIGVAGFGYYGRAEKPVETQAVCQQSLSERWAQCYNEEGFLLIEDSLASRYKIFKRHKHAENSPPELKKTLIEKIKAEIDAKQAEFEKDIVPENYTPAIMYRMYGTAHCLQNLITDNDVMPTIMEIFSFTSKNPLYKELRQKTPENDYKLVEQMLSCAVLMTHKRLTKQENELGDSKEEFLDHLRKKIGDCSDYSYAAADLYNLICHNMGRPDLAPKIRLMTGAGVRPDGTFNGYHGWMQILNPDGRWHDLEIVEDYIKEDTPVSMATPALYRLNTPDGNFYIPFVSTTVVPKKGGGYRIDFRSHITPVENGKEK